MELGSTPGIPPDTMELIVFHDLYQQITYLTQESYHSSKNITIDLLIDFLFFMIRKSQRNILQGMAAILSA